MPPASSSSTDFEERIEIRTPSDVVYAQTRAKRFAGMVGFDKRQQWEIAIAVSEAATNILKFAETGAIVFRALIGSPAGIEVEAIDHGPGIDDVDSALQDGYSEGRMLSLETEHFHRRGIGGGLGAMARMTNDIRISRPPEGGTSIIARKYLPE